MPYIDQPTRGALLNNRLCELLDEHLITQLQIGDINFIISSLIWARWKAAPSYSTGNALVGVLECAKQEFYRRHLVPYEQKKMKSNGDLEL